MKTVLLTLTAVSGLFIASCSCHSGASKAEEPASEPAPSYVAPAYVAPAK